MTYLQLSKEINCKVEVKERGSVIMEERLRERNIMPAA